MSPDKRNGQELRANSEQCCRAAELLDQCAQLCPAGPFQSPLRIASALPNLGNMFLSFRFPCRAILKNEKMFLLFIHLL
jgi:hypothetical protein